MIPNRSPFQLNGHPHELTHCYRTWEVSCPECLIIAHFPWMSHYISCVNAILEQDLLALYGDITPNLLMSHVFLLEFEKAMALASVCDICPNLLMSCVFFLVEIWNSYFEELKTVRTWRNGLYGRFWKYWELETYLYFFFVQLVRLSIVETGHIVLYTFLI